MPTFDEETAAGPFDDIGPSDAGPFDDIPPSVGRLETAAGRFATGVIPTAGFGATFGAVTPWATAAFAATPLAPAAPILGPLTGLVAGTGVAMGLGKGQHEILKATVPEFVARQEAGAAQNPKSAFFGDLASGAPSFRLARQPADWAAKQIALRAGFGGAIGAVQPALLEQRAPTLEDVGKGAAFTLAYGAPRRWLGPPKILLPRAARAAGVAKGKDAGEVEEAIEVHADVSAQPGKGPGQVPIEEGGAGVRPKAQGQVLLRDNLYEGTDPPPDEAFNVTTRKEGGQTIYRYRLTKREPEPLTPEEQAMIDAEREAIDAPIKVVKEEPEDPNVPFSARKRKPGVVAVFNRKTGEIDVFEQEFKRWLADTPPEQRKAATAELLWEEQIHSKIQDNTAELYWNTLSKIERAIEERIYTGQWGEKARVNYGDSPVLWGQEALRRRLQIAMRGTAREFAEAALRERWTIKGLHVLETAIRGAREALTKTGVEGKALADRALENIGVAKAVVSGEEPAAYRKQRPLTEEETAQRFGITVEELRERRRRQEAALRAPSAAAPRAPVEVQRPVPSAEGRRTPEERAAHDAKIDAMIRGLPREKTQQQLAEEEMGPVSKTVPLEEIAEEIGLSPTGELIPGKTRPASRASAESAEELAKFDEPAAFRKKALSEEETAARLGISVQELRDRRKRQTEAMTAPAAKEPEKPAEPIRPPTEEEIQARLAKVDEMLKNLPRAQKAEGGRAARGQTKQKSEPGQEKMFAEEMTALGVPSEVPARKPSAVEAGAGVPEEAIGGAYRVPTGAELESGIAAELGRADPSFERFAQVASKKYGPRLQPGHLLETWRDKVMGYLHGKPATADSPAQKGVSGQRLKEMLRGLNLETRVVGSSKTHGRTPHQRFESLKIADAPEPAQPEVAKKGKYGELVLEVEREGGAAEAKITSAAEKSRNLAIAQIASKLISRAEEFRMSRAPQKKELTPEDIGWWRGNAWKSVSESDAKSIGKLTELVKAGARAKGKEVSRSNLVLALADTKTGQVDLVSAYLDPRRGPVITDPARVSGMAPISVPLADRMNRFRVIYRGLLDEPVKDFRQTFKSEAEFKAEFAKEANREASREAAAEARRAEEATEEAVRTREAVEPGEERFEFDEPYETTPAEQVSSVLESGELTRRTKPLTDAEAGAVYEVTKEAKSPTEVANMVARIRGQIEKSKATATEIVKARQALEEAFQANKEGALERPVERLTELKANVDELLSRYETEQPNRAAISGLNKVFREILGRDPEMTSAQALEKMYSEIHRRALIAEDKGAFSEGLLKSFGREAGRSERDVSLFGASPEAERLAQLKRGAPTPAVVRPSFLEGRYFQPAEPPRPKVEAAERELKLPVGRGFARGFGARPVGGRIPTTPPKMLGLAGEAHLRGQAEIPPPFEPEIVSRQLWPAVERQRPERPFPGGPMRGEPGFVPPEALSSKQSQRLNIARMRGVGERQRPAFQMRPSKTKRVSDIMDPGTSYEVQGPVEPASFRKSAAKRAVNVVRDTILDPIAAYSEWMVDRLRRSGGPVSKAFADIANKQISREKELYGGLIEHINPGKREAGKLNPGTTWLHGHKEITEDAAISNFFLALENKTSVPASAQKAVSLAQSGNLEIGNVYTPVTMVKMSGYWTTTKSGGRYWTPGKTVPFSPKGNAQRNLTALGYDIVRQGRGEAWDNIVEGNAIANKVPKAEMEAFFTKWKKVLDEPGPDFNKIERVNQDFMRLYPKAITHVKIAGKWEPIIHSDLFNYLEQAARRATHTRSFREVFPNDPAGRKAFAAMDEQLRTEIGPEYQATYDSLVRALQGHPTDNYSRLGFMAPGKTIPEAFRFLNNTLGNLMARMVLSGQMFVQPGENIAGSAQVFFGYKNWLRAAARLKQMWAETEKIGSTNKVFYDMSFDPHSAVRSSFRIAGNLLSKGFGQQLLNEFQERHAATLARVVRDRIEAGTLTDWEKRILPQTFKAMGFTKPQVGDLLAGNAELLGQFERKSAAFLTSGNKAIAEGSALGANRLFNSIFRFQHYPMMKMNQFRKVFTGLTEAWRSGTPAEKRAATELFSRFMFGSAAQGALTVGITTLAYQGLFGAKIAKEEATDEPFKFLLESFLSAMSGPLYLAWRGARSGGVQGIGEQAMRTVFPYGVVSELHDLSTGAGAYRDRDTYDRIGQFLQRKIPGTKAVGTGLALFGLGQENKKLDASINAYYRWRRKELGGTRYETFLKEDERKGFRTGMRKAVEALKGGDEEGFWSAVKSAVGSQQEIAKAKGRPVDWDKMARSLTSSLMARRILVSPTGERLSDEQLASLRERIGNEAVDRLEYFDLMIEAAAKAWFVAPKFENRATR